MSVTTPATVLLPPINSTTAAESILVVHEGTAGLWGPKRDPLWVVIPVTVYYAIVLVSGVVGNVSTCVVIARNKHMHTATNYYLFSLAISDLLLLLSGLPQEMYHIWSNYPYVFGETFCILAGLASETSTNATVLTITAFTVERYVAICHPFLSHTVSKLSRAIKFIMAIWTMSFCLAVPQAIQMGLVYLRDDNGDIVSEEYKSCTLKHSIAPSSFFVSTVVFFLAPMTLITALYVLIGVRLHRSSQITQGGGAGVPSQRRRRRTLLVGSRDKETTIIVRGSQRNGPHSKSTKRVVKMLVSVVVAFFICWAPFQVQRLYAIYGFAGDNTTSTDILVYKVMTYASGLLYYLSTTINPILYNIMSLKFRQAFKSTLTKCLGQELRRSGEMSSGGGGGGSQGAGRLKFAASRGNNNSGSSGSYAEAGDLSRRPLVVSFRRRSPRTSSTSLDRRCCELPPPYRAPELMDVPEVSNSPSTDDCALRPHIRPCAPPPYSAPDLTLPRHCPTLTSTPVPREPRVEDIEIFHECQLRILESVRTRRKEPMCAVAVRREDQGESGQGQDPLKYVRKSLTDPCLTMH